MLSYLCLVHDINALLCVLYFSSRAFSSYVIDSLSLTKSIDSLFTFPHVPELSASLRAVYLSYERFKALRAQRICLCDLRVVIIFV